MKTNNKNVGKRCIEFVKNHRIIFSISFIVIAILIIILPQVIFKVPLIVDDRISGIELIMFSSQIVSAIFVIIGTIIAVWQYCLSSSKRIKELEFSRVEKAIELSNYYKDNILNRYSVLKHVFNDCGITIMLQNKRKSCEIKDFDVIELKEFYSEAEIKMFANLSSNEQFLESIIKVASSLNIELKGYNKCIKKNDDGTQTVAEISANPNEVYSDFFKTYITQTLNNLEYFAMAFTHKTADESVIYQSIYPTYLEMCFIMYYFIARHSDPKESKLYTNLASLYCIWREREQAQKRNINEQARSVGIHSGTIVD